MSHSVSSFLHHLMTEKNPTAALLDTLYRMSYYDTELSKEIGQPGRRWVCDRDHDLVHWHEGKQATKQEGNSL